MKITKKDIENFVDEPYLSRGNAYFQRRLVQFVSIKSDQVKAHVLGTKMYVVNLKMRNFSFDGDCNCVAFEDYGPCKHIAATGFALIQQAQGNGYRPSEECFEANREYERLEKYLSSKKKEELIAIIMKFASDDPEFMYDLEDER